MMDELTILSTCWETYAVQLLPDMVELKGLHLGIDALALTVEVLQTIVQGRNPLLQRTLGRDALKREKENEREKPMAHGTNIAQPNPRSG